jgi:hypothetical protein
MQPLGRARFEALCYSRSPFANWISEEREWYSDAEERVLGMVLLDRCDQDWLWIMMGRDKTGLFRAIDLNCSLSSVEEAREQLRVRLDACSATGKNVFEQGDEPEKKKTLSLFVPQGPDEQLNPIFRYIAVGEHHSAARGIMEEIAHAFVDVDGNYTKDFQTTGFNARLWEFYLFAFFYEQRFSIRREFVSPDFCLEKDGFPVGVEAVTVNPSAGETPPKPINDEELKRLRQDYMPIKFGSSLYSKLNRKTPYWELPHMRGKPFILAIHDYLVDDSMTWSAPALEDYLFGSRAAWSKDASGKLHIVEEPIKEHVWGTKKIPSGFFQLPGAENVSAVIFSNAATVSKFNRMGKLAGFGNPKVLMRRIGLHHDFDPNATMPIPFNVEVTPDTYRESWAEGVRLYHNPRARLPIPDGVFTDCAHYVFENGKRRAFLPDPFIHESRTLVVAPKSSGDEK